MRINITSLTKFARAYTLVEVLAVTVIMIAIVVLLLPNLSGARRAAFIANCSMNQKQIYNSYQTYLTDTTKQKRYFSTSIWPYQLAEYLKDKKTIFSCPEAVYEDLNVGKTGGEWFVGIRGNWVDMETGIFARKISLDQYNDINQRFGSGDGSWRGFFDMRDGPSVYVQEGGYLPDPSGEYFLLFEDAGWPNAPAGDQDFNDMMLHIKPLTDGNVHIRARRWTSGKLTFARGEHKKDEFGLNNPYAWPMGSWTHWESVYDSVFSYGMNEQVNEVKDSKIFMMDYVRTDVRLDPVLGHNWDDYRNDFGNYKFARHMSGTSNVTFMDGSVTLLDPETVDPSFSLVRKNFWEPTRK